VRFADEVVGRGLGWKEGFGAQRREMGGGGEVESSNWAVGEGKG